MNKIMSKILLVFILAFGLTGCGNKISNSQISSGLVKLDSHLTQYNPKDDRISCKFSFYTEGFWGGKTYYPLDGLFEFRVYNAKITKLEEVNSSEPYVTAQLTVNVSDYKTDSSGIPSLELSYTREEIVKLGSTTIMLVPLDNKYKKLDLRFIPISTDELQSFNKQLEEGVVIFQKSNAPFVDFLSMYNLGERNQVLLDKKYNKVYVKTSVIIDRIVNGVGGIPTVYPFGVNDHSMLRFNRLSIDKLSQCSPGDQITVIGQVNTGGLVTISLSDCEILDIK